MLGDFIDANIRNDNSSEVICQLIELLKAVPLSKTLNYGKDKVYDLMSIILRLKDDLGFVEMYIRVIFSINPYDYQDPNQCPYLVLFDKNRYSSSSPQSELGQLLNRSNDLSKGINMAMAIICITYLHQLSISKDHTGFVKKRKRQNFRRIIDNSDEDDDKLNITDMLHKTVKLIRKYADNQADFIYQAMHIVFTVSIVIGQHQQQHQDNTIKITLNGLKSSLAMLILSLIHISEPTRPY